MRIAEIRCSSQAHIPGSVFFQTFPSPMSRFKDNSVAFIISPDYSPQRTQSPQRRIK
jgi:hypothetical protein